MSIIDHIYSRLSLHSCTALEKWNREKEKEKKGEIESKKTARKKKWKKTVVIEVEARGGSNKIWYFRLFNFLFI